MPILNGFPQGGGDGKFLPLTGGTMSGSIAMGSNKLTGLANGTATGDAVNLGQLNGKLSTSGGTMSGALNMGSNKITNLAAGTASTDAVTYAQLRNAVAIPSHTTTLSSRVGSITLVWTPFGVFFASGNYINESFSISKADITSIEAVISSVLPGFTISTLSCKCSYYNNGSLTSCSIEITSTGYVTVNTYTHGFFVYTSF